MKNKKGSVLILGLLMMAILLLFGGVFLSLTLINYNAISLSGDILKAHWIAYAGIKKIAWELKDNYSNVEFQSRIEDFIFEHIPKEARIEEGKLQRQEKWLYPPKAIREALANALSHRNYETTANVQIRIFDDRLEIWNPGCLPQGITIEKLRTKHDSVPRNHLIFRAFFWIKYVEEVGTGTNKIIKWCKEWELPEPNFEETGTSFVLTFRRHFIDENILESLNERQKKAIEYLKQNKYITNREYRKINEIGKVISVKELNFMVKKDIVKKVGKGRSLKYELND